MGIKTIIRPQGTIRIVLQRHIRNVEDLRRLPIPLDGFGRPAGFFIGHNDAQQSLKGQNMVFLEWSDRIEGPWVTAPLKQRIHLTKERSVQQAENMNRLLDDFRKGNRDYMTELELELCEHHPNVAFVGGVQREKNMVDQAIDFEQSRNRWSWLTGGVSVLLAAWPWKSEIKGPARSVKQKGKPVQAPVNPSRRRFLKAIGSTAILGFGSAIASAIDNTGRLFKKMSNNLEEPGEVDGFREAERKFIGLETRGKAQVDLRNAIFAHQIDGISRALFEREKKINGSFYVGPHHAEVIEHLRDLAYRDQVWQKYAHEIERYIDPELSEHVVLLQYDPKTKEYAPQLLHFPGIFKESSNQR